jgi:peptidoglycan hydrolase CwlO-like protein
METRVCGETLSRRRRRSLANDESTAANLVFNRKKQEKQLQEDLKDKDKTIDSLYKEVGQLTLKVNWAEKKIREFGL